MPSINNLDVQRFIARNKTTKKATLDVPQTKGLFLVVRNGVAKWFFRYQLPQEPGRPRPPRVSMGIGDYHGENFRLEHAQKEALALYTRVREGANVKQEARAAVVANLGRAAANDYTVSHLIDDYRADMECEWSDQTRKKFPPALEEIRRYIGKIGVPLVTDDMIVGMLNEVVKEQKAKGHSGAKSKYILDLTATVFNWAVEKRKIRNNPTRGVYAPVLPGTRDRKLDAKEIGRLWANLTHWHDRVYGVGRPLTLAYKIALITGIRIGAIIRTRVDELDFDGIEGWAGDFDQKPIWKITPGQGKKMRLRKKPKGNRKVPPPRAQLVPLSPLAVQTWKQAISMKQRADNPYVFEGHHGKHIANNSASVGFVYVKEAGLAPADMVLHNMRHTAVTWWGDLTARHNQPPQICEMMLGHKTKGEIEGIYNLARYIPSQRIVANVWSQRLSEMIKGAEPGFFQAPTDAPRVKAQRLWSARKKTKRVNLRKKSLPATDNVVALPKKQAA